MIADLHCHTRMSDGSTGIDEIVFLAKKRGIKTLAVADHDTFAGSIRAQILGKRYGVKVISAVEISAFDYKRGKNVHILAYLCDHPDRMEGLFKRISEARKQKAVAMLKKVMRVYPIYPEMVTKRAHGSTNVFKQHIMQALMDSGYSTSIYGDLFDKLFASEKGLAYTEAEYPDVYEVIDYIHSAGGLAVLAHPAKYDSYELLGELVDHDLDGVEVWYPNSREDDKKLLSVFAKQHNLIMVGGSNFHGMYSKDLRPLGLFTTPEEELQKMLSRKSQK